MPGRPVRRTHRKITHRYRISQATKDAIANAPLKYPDAHLDHSTLGDCKGPHFSTFKCDNACKVRHPPRPGCPHEASRDRLRRKWVNKKELEFRDVCTHCHALQTYHNRSVQRRKGTITKWKKPTKARSVPPAFSRDKTRLQNLAYVRCFYNDYKQTLEKVRESDWRDSNPTVRKVFVFLLRCARDGSVKGSDYGLPMTDEEAEKIIIGLDGHVKCWYSGEILPIQEKGKQCDFNWFSPDRLIPGLPYDDPAQIVVATSKAANMFYNALSLDQRIMLTIAYQNRIDSVRAAESVRVKRTLFNPLDPEVSENDLAKFKNIVQTTVGHHTSRTTGRNERRKRKNLPDLPSAWSKEQGYDYFLSMSGVSQLTGVSLIDCPLFWNISFDRQTDDLPYSSSTVFLCSTFENLAKSTFACFRTRKALKAELKKRKWNDRGFTNEEAIQEIFLEWFEPFVANTTLSPVGWTNSKLDKFRRLLNPTTPYDPRTFSAPLKFGKGGVVDDAEDADDDEGSEAEEDNSL